jgi:gas vesicle protein
MIRILTVAAAAAMLIAAPASAQSMRVAVAGKSTEQLHTDINAAAKKVCMRAVVGASFPREMYASCFKAAVADAVTKANDPALASAAGIKLASR